MYKDICRIVKHETPDGTFYLAQRLVYKKPWFKTPRHEWEYFSMKKNDITGKKYFEKLSPLQFEDRAFLDKSAAEYYCETWARVKSTGAPVKIWSIGE